MYYYKQITYYRHGKKIYRKNVYFGCAPVPVATTPEICSIAQSIRYRGPATKAEYEMFKRWKGERIGVNAHMAREGYKLI